MLLFAGVPRVANQPPGPEPRPARTGLLGSASVEQRRNGGLLVPFASHLTALTGFLTALTGLSSSARRWNLAEKRLACRLGPAPRVGCRRPGPCPGRRLVGADRGAVDEVDVLSLLAAWVDGGLGVGQAPCPGADQVPAAKAEAGHGPLAVLLRKPASDGRGAQPREPAVEHRLVVVVGPVRQWHR